MIITNKEQQVFGRVEQHHFGTISYIQTRIYSETVKTFDKKKFNDFY